jgi:hypothetical protein
MAIRIRALACIALLAATACSGSATTTTHVAAPISHGHERRHHEKTAHHHRHHHRQHRPRIVPAADLPNPRLTPGAILTTSRSVVCRSGYAARVRDVSESEKAAVYARYGVPWVPDKHEVDHLVSLELGGSNAITNLWPEPYAGRWGARTKDVLENTLHDLVCSGAIPLRYAQHIEATGWIRAYRRYVGRL